MTRCALLSIWVFSVKCSHCKHKTQLVRNTYHCQSYYFLINVVLCLIFNVEIIMKLINLHGKDIAEEKFL